MIDLDAIYSKCQVCGDEYDVNFSARLGCLEPVVYCSPTCRSLATGKNASRAIAADHADELAAKLKRCIEFVRECAQDMDDRISPGLKGKAKALLDDLC